MPPCCVVCAKQMVVCLQQLHWGTAAAAVIPCAGHRLRHITAVSLTDSRPSPTLHTRHACPPLHCLQVHLRHLVGGRARGPEGELPNERIFQVFQWGQIAGCSVCYRTCCPASASSRRGGWELVAEPPLTAGRSAHPAPARDATWLKARLLRHGAPGAAGCTAQAVTHR